eukprot:8595947-Alexandrium_andersonii.AAC.1
MRQLPHPLGHPAIPSNHADQTTPPARVQNNTPRLEGVKCNVTPSMTPSAEPRNRNARARVN